VRSARAVLQAGQALLVEALDPAMTALARDAHGLGGVSHRPALKANPFDEQLTATDVETCITVSHEGLL
jgi:hypothetical protein